MSDSIDVLLERLASGDETAACEAFRTYEPHLRMVVRRNLSARVRAKFDSVDVVQSVWADLLQGFRTGRWQFTDAAHFRAFLVKATKNRFLNRLRRHRTAVEREQPMPDAEVVGVVSATPAPSEQVQAEDTWSRLVALCPPAHRELLALKRQGLSLDELAQRTGLHKSSIRRILYELARRFSEAGEAVSPVAE
jgi:RNA polymerase sigma factor (sigma-70 family)